MTGEKERAAIESIGQNLAAAAIGMSGVSAAEAAAGRVAAGKMREGEAEMHIDLMRNVLETLEWLHKNEATVKAAVAKKEQA